MTDRIVASSLPVQFQILHSHLREFLPTAATPPPERPHAVHFTIVCRYSVPFMPLPTFHISITSCSTVFRKKIQ